MLSYAFSENKLSIIHSDELALAEFVNSLTCKHKAMNFEATAADESGVTIKATLR